MRVTLVNPRRLDTPNHPLGILYIAAFLENNGFEVSVVDPNFDASVELATKMILKSEPDVVGIGMTTPQVDFAIRLSKKIKSLRPELPTVFGGVHPTVMPKDVLSESSVDYVVIGEGEITVLDLFNSLLKNQSVNKIDGIGYKRNGKLIFTKPRKLIEELDTLPFPARHLLPSRWFFAPPRIRGTWTKSTANVMASRGCPYRCIFCSSHLMFGRRVRFRKIKCVIEELKHLRRDFNIDSVWFADDTFTINPKWVKEFCGGLRKLKWKDFKWACQARVNTVSYEMLKDMKRAGCRQVDFGVESGSPKILKIMKKDITPEMVVHAFRIAKKAGLLRFASFMIGIPGETEEDIKMTEKLALKIKPDYTDFFFAVPYPGTELYQLAKEYGVFDNVDNYNKWILGKQTDKPVMCASLSEDILIKWRSRLHNHFFLSNYKGFLRDPSFLFGGFKIFFNGLNGLIPGISRTIKTGKFDSIFVEVLREYRRKMKRIEQDGFRRKE